MQALESYFTLIAGFIMLILTIAFGVVSVAAAHKSRKYASIIKNSAALVNSIGDVMAAIYEARGCLWDIQYYVEKKVTIGWEDAMRRKRTQAGILIAKAGSCSEHIDDVLRLGETLFGLDMDQKEDYDADGHSGFYLDADNLLGKLRNTQRKLAALAEGLEIDST